MNKKNIGAKKPSNFMEIVDMKDDPREEILNLIKKYGFATRSMILNNLSLTTGVADGVIRELRRNDIIKSTKKLVKFKGERDYKNVVGYQLVRS